jgi:hypothetical protein
MQIQVNTDRNIKGDERVIEIVEKIVKDVLKPISSRITRVEVHIKDVRGPKGGEDIQATIEARPEGLRPYAAQENGTEIAGTVKGAAKKLRLRLDGEFQKLSARRP